MIFVKKNIINILFCFAFVLSMTGIVSLYIEFKYQIASTHAELYPGLFQWPLYFSLISCIILCIMTKIIIDFIIVHIKKWKIGLIFYILPILVYTIGMSFYEWNAQKYATYEISPKISSIENIFVKNRSLSSDVRVAGVDSFDDYTLSIKNKPRKNAYVKQCKFNGKDGIEYDTRKCHCVISNKIQDGKSCEIIKNIWYKSLEYHTNIKKNVSYTFYFSRISFSALVLIFSFGFMNAIFIVLLGDYMKIIDSASYRKSLFFIQLFSIFSIIWWIMRFYFVEMQSLIFPITQNSILANRALLYMVLAPVIIGFLYAFGANIKIVKSILEDFTIPIIAIIAAFLGLAQKEMAMYVFGIFFGVESNAEYRAIFITMVFALLVPPLYKYMREAGVFEFNR